MKPVDVNARLTRLFQITGLADDPPASDNPVLNEVDKWHFRYVLLSAALDSLQIPFLQMAEGMPQMASEAPLLQVEQQAGSLVDQLVSELQISAERAHFPLPYSDSDALWRRVAYASLAMAEEEAAASGQQTIELDEVVLRIALMVDGPEGLQRLEHYIRRKGYTMAEANELDPKWDWRNLRETASPRNRECEI